jgi:sec-independent protein translocase protein TatC
MEGYEKHINELRKRLIYSAVALVAFTAAIFIYSGKLLELFKNDLGFQLYAFQPYEVFYTQIMMSVLIGFIASIPVVIYQVLKFVKPGLRDHEYRTIRNFLPFSVILFLGGAAFAYEFIVKTSLTFFQGINQSTTVGALWGLQNTVGYTIKISAFTGLFFQIPIISAVLAKTGLLDSDMMKKYRRHFFVAVLVAAAVATPPDVVTQILLVTPVLGLYQASIYLVKKINR